MKIALKFAGYSLNEADTLRKAITRLSSSEMEKQRSRFLSGSLKRGYSIDTSTSIFELISKFASYGFVKAHAAAYSEISYRISYIKAYFPAELISSILTNNSGYYGQGQYIEEARRLGLNIKLPDINRSQEAFTVEDEGKSIRIPLISVKELGPAASRSIIADRSENGPFRDFLDFYYRTARSCRLTKNAVENLIKIGAFDYAGLKRRYLLTVFYYLRTSKNLTVEQARLTLYPHSKLSLAGRQGFTFEDKLKIEAIVLGFCVGASPLDYFKNELKSFKIIPSSLFSKIINTAGPGFSGNIFTAGTIINRRIEKTRDGKNMLFCTIEDRDGMFESVFFPVSYLENSNILTNRSIVIVAGRLHYKDGDITLIGDKAIDLFHLKKISSDFKKENLKQGILAEAGPVW
jgi:DNA polymerase-3 subunit alpha